jgi:hypothetical protein
MQLALYFKDYYSEKEINTLKPSLTGPAPLSCYLKQINSHFEGVGSKARCFSESIEFTQEPTTFDGSIQKTFFCNTFSASRYLLQILRKQIN